MTGRQSWGQRLDPFARLYADMQTTIDGRIESASDDDLRKLAKACDRPTQTNCWWATLHVAPLVADAIKVEQYRRRKQAKEARQAARAAAKKVSS
jgi:hypothetical protein